MKRGSNLGKEIEKKSRREALVHLNAKFNFRSKYKVTLLGRSEHADSSEMEKS